MPQARYPTQPLPRIHGATSPNKAMSRPYAAAADDTRAAEPMTAGWTGRAALRRVYAPSPPPGGSRKGRGRSPVPPLSTSPVQAGAGASRGHGHHLAPLDAVGGAPRSHYDDDACRFLLAMEESQRTAVKFEERRRRLQVAKMHLAGERLLDSMSPSLYASEPPLLLLHAQAEEAATAPRPSRAELRPLREQVAGHMVDSLIHSQCEECHRRQPRRVLSPPLPHLWGEEAEQLSTLRATDDAASTTPRAAPTATGDTLRPLHLAAAGALIDAWWSGFEAASAAAAVRKRSSVAARAEEEEVEAGAAVLHSAEEEAPHTPTAFFSSREVMYPVRRAEAAQLVDDVLRSYRPRSPPPPPLRTTAVGSPRSASEEETATLGADNAGRGLRFARELEAAEWVGAALHAATASPPSQRTVVSSAAERQLPRFIAHDAEPPRRCTPDASTSSEESSGSADVSLRAVRRAEAAAWVADAFHHRTLIPAAAAEVEEVTATEAVEHHDGLRAARQAAASHLVGEAFAEQRTRNVAQPRSVGEEAPRPSAQVDLPSHLHAFKVEAPSAAAAATPVYAAAATPSLYELRMGVAAALVHESLVVPHVAPERQSRGNVPLYEHVDTSAAVGGDEAVAQRDPVSGTQRSSQSLRDARLLVAVELVNGLCSSSEVFHVAASVRCLHSTASPSAARDPLRASEATTTAAAQSAPPQPLLPLPPQHNVDLRQARRVVAQALVNEAWSSRWVAASPSAEHHPTLRVARHKEAARLVGSVM